MVKLFVCMDCNVVVVSDNWEKYHCTLNSCPDCNGDMCGCNSCAYDIKEKKLSITYIDMNNELHKCTAPNGANDCINKTSINMDCDIDCPYYEECLC